MKGSQLLKSIAQDRGIHKGIHRGIAVKSETTGEGFNLAEILTIQEQVIRGRYVWKPTRRYINTKGAGEQLQWGERYSR